MNKKSFIESVNEVLDFEDPRMSLHLKSGTVIRVMANKKTIRESFVVFPAEYDNSPAYIVPYEAIEYITF